MPELRARHADVPPKLDGILDDAVWSTDALPMDKWVSYNPMRGEPALQRTDVWVAYDDKALYFAFRCYDTEPQQIRTTISKRDNVWNDDWVAVSLDSSRTSQVAYHMFVNPSGIQMDALNTGANGEDTSPDWVWDSAGRVDGEGYVVEMRLPLESIRFRSGTDVRMGIMFFRRISRLGVSWSWPEMTPGQWVFETHVPVVFSELRQRRIFEVIPSAVFSRNQARLASEGWPDPVTESHFGASLKYGLTSTVTLDTTFNPDFSQVESDAFEVEVNPADLRVMVWDASMGIWRYVGGTVSPDGFGGYYVIVQITHFSDYAVFDCGTIDHDGDGAPSACDIDDDNDLCIDQEELGPNHQLGGERDPFNYYDFFDVNGDAYIDLGDTLKVLTHFGHGKADDPSDDIVKGCVITRGGEIVNETIKKL